MGAVALAACTTPYQQMGWRGGYMDERLPDGTYIVTVRVNGYTDASAAFAYFSRRAAEICAGRSFEVLDRMASSQQSLSRNADGSVSLDEKPRYVGRIRCI